MPMSLCGYTNVGDGGVLVWTLTWCVAGIMAVPTDSYAAGG